MDAFDLVLTLAFVGLAAFQIWLTVRVFRSTIYEKRQKILQAQLIWLVPILGAGIVFAVLRDNEADDNRKTTTKLES